MGVKISQAERMINLLALLVQRSQPLTLRQIRNELGSQYPEGDVAARAAFERDKAELRDMGIPIEMVTLGGDRAGEGAYTVDRRSYELSDLGLTDTELEALKLAAATVRIGAAHGEAALWKLGGERALEQPLTSVHIELDRELMPVLAEGVVERRVLQFVYNGENRSVHPYGLLARGGFWYIVGFDELRADRRVFRVDRIEGGVVAGAPKSFSRPDGFDLAKAVATEHELLADGDGAHSPARVLVDVSLATRVRADFGEDAVARVREDGAIEFNIPCANLAAFRVWLFAMVDRAEVLGPPEIRAQVREWLNEFVGGTQS
ncbi:MAG: helix-turn-helix transcriptional regulator [Ilumatobacteraceae bacterium]